MEWYYSQENDKLGPITAAELLEKSEHGEVSSDALVWTEGMADWMAVGRTRPRVIAAVLEADPALVQCAFSGNLIQKDQALEYGDQFILPEHKDQFVQQLAEGEIPKAEVPFDKYGTELQFGSILSRSWDIFKGNFVLLMLVHFSVWLLLDQMTAYMDATVFAQMEEMESFRRSMNFERLLNSMVGIIATAGFFQVCMNHTVGRKTTYGEAMATGMRLWGKIWITRFLQGCILFGGLIVCIIPIAILLAVFEMSVLVITISFIVVLIPLIGWFASRIAFSLPYVAETRISGMAAMKKSFALTKGRVWRVVGYYTLMTLIFIIPIFLPFVATAIPALDSPIPTGIITTISGFIGSFYVVFTYAFYKQIRIFIGEDGLDS